MRCLYGGKISFVPYLQLFLEAAAAVGVGSVAQRVKTSSAQSAYSGWKRHMHGWSFPK